MKHLRKIDLTELDSNELHEIEGGFLLAVATGIAAGLVISAIDNWSDIKRGTMDAHRFFN